MGFFRKHKPLYPCTVAKVAAFDPGNMIGNTPDMPPMECSNMM